MEESESTTEFHGAVGNEGGRSRESILQGGSGGSANSGGSDGGPKRSGAGGYRAGAGRKPGGTNRVGGGAAAGPPPTGGTKPPRVNVVEAVGGGEYNVTSRQGKGKDAENIAKVIAVASNIVASFRGDHWKKTAKDCLPVAEPIAAGISDLPKEVRDSVAKYSMPGMLLLGLATVFGESISVELEINAIQRQAQRQGGSRPGGVPAQPQGAVRPNPAPFQAAQDLNGGPVGDHSGANGTGQPRSKVEGILNNIILTAGD